MIEKIKPIVIKIGTTSLTGRKAGEGINCDVLESLATAAAEIIRSGTKVIIVSSGAMGLGIAKLGIAKLEERADLTTVKQALTSVGQVALMNAYAEAFSKHGLHVGQVLLTHHGLHDPKRSATIKNTISKLFELNIIPIINENDTVTAEEIEFGDNDTLSAEVAVLNSAKTLYILTDTEGLYDSDPHKNPNAKLINQVSAITDEIRTVATGSSSKTGTGGMASKIMAAEICLAKSVPLHILSVRRLPELAGLEAGLGTRIGTKFSTR